MTDTIARLRNWGAWSQTDTGAPQGYPSQSPMFAGANRKDWRDPGWGDEEGVPEEIPVPVNVPDAEYVDKLICTIKSERLKLALLIEYASAPRSFRFRRYGYDESVKEAERLVTDILHGETKKAVVMRLLASGERCGRRIAEVVGVSESYVSQIRSMTTCK